MCMGVKGGSPDLLDCSLDGQCISYFSCALDRVSDRSSLERFKLAGESEYNIVHDGEEGIVVEEALCWGLRRTKLLVV